MNDLEKHMLFREILSIANQNILTTTSIDKLAVTLLKIIAIFSSLCKKYIILLLIQKRYIL